MSDHVTALLGAIDGKDPDGMRAAYTADARLVTMTPNTFNVDVGAEAIGVRLAEWYASWEEDPAFAFLGRVEDGERVVVEFERTSTYDGASWVVRQAHVMDVGPDGIREHRIYCCGPRQGSPDLAATFAAAR